MTRILTIGASERDADWIKATAILRRPDLATYPDRLWYMQARSGWWELSTSPRFGEPVRFVGRALNVPRRLEDAARYLGVRQDEAGGFDVDDFRTQLLAVGADAVAYRDPHAGGREALAVFEPAMLEIVS